VDDSDDYDDDDFESASDGVVVNQCLPGAGRSRDGDDDDLPPLDLDPLAVRRAHAVEEPSLHPPFPPSEEAL
jgi:hypothetical protein